MRYTMFEFIYHGQTIVFEGYDLQEAINDANEMFNVFQGNPGVWQKREFEPHKYTWIEITTAN